MKVLLVGFGDIAARVAAQLPASAAAVGLRRTPSAAPGHSGAAALELRAVDASKADALAAVLTEPFDYVVATLTPSAMSEAGYRASYLAVAENLAALLPQHPSLRRLLWVSSSSVYGDQRGDQWVDEQTAAKPQRATAKVLLAAEHALAALPCTVLRFSGIYGPGRHRLLQLVRAGGPLPGAPEQWSNRIHSDDGAGFIAHLIAAQWRGERLAPLYIVSDQQPAPLGEVWQWLATQLGCAQPLAAPQQSSGRGGKRLRATLMQQSGYTLRYPSYRDGYAALLAAERS